MKLGKKSGGPELAMPSTKSKPTIQYPQVTVEKPIGAYKFGDEFTATVKFRVMNVEHGKSYSGADPRHRCTLEMLSITPTSYKKKGLPHS